MTSQNAPSFERRSTHAVAIRERHCHGAAKTPRAAPWCDREGSRHPALCDESRRRDGLRKRLVGARAKWSTVAIISEPIALDDVALKASVSTSTRHPILGFIVRRVSTGVLTLWIVSISDLRCDEHPSGQRR